MDDIALTRRAIAELIQELPVQNGKVLSKPLERKINPLSKPNKKFLGRTINSALLHNKRKNERTQASCQEKLQELDERHEKRKQNVFYSSIAGKESVERSRHKRYPKKKSEDRLGSEGHRKPRPPTRISRREYRSRSSRRSRAQKTKPKKQSRSKSSSSLSCNESGLQSTITNEGTSTVPTSTYYMYSNNMAIAVAMAYGQALCAPESENTKSQPFDSLSYDINSELFSDDDTLNKDFQSNALTIDISSQDDQSEGSSESDSEAENKTISHVSLKESNDDNAELSSNSSSDMEIVEQAQEKSAEPKSKLTFAYTSTFEIAHTFDLTDE